MSEYLTVFMWAVGIVISLVNAWAIFALRIIRAELKTLGEEDKALLRRIENERGVLHKRVGDLKDHVETDFVKLREFERMEARVAEDLSEIKAMVKEIRDRGQ